MMPAGRNPQKLKDKGRQRNWVRCLGPAKREHFFRSDGPQHRVCARCRLRQVELNPSARDLAPVRIVMGRPENAE